MNRREFSRNIIAAGLLASLFQKRVFAAPSSEAIQVDTHSHIFLRSLHLAQVHRYVPDYDAPLSEYIRQLDTHGSTSGVLIQPSFLGTDNGYLVAALKQYPKRLRGIVVIEPTFPEDELRKLDESGVVGIRLNLIGESIPDFQSTEWQLFLARLKALNWQVEVQREARDLPLLVGPLLKAGVNVVVDHFGRPDPKLGTNDPGFQYLLSAAATNRLWIKLSGAYRNGANGRGEEIAQEAIPLLLSSFGAKRLLWGSDWPHTQFEKVASYASARADLDRWIPDPAVRGIILNETPRELFRI